MTPTGPAFAHPAPTTDTDRERWVACDESGWDGEQLLNGSRYLVYASVAIDGGVGRTDGAATARGHRHPAVT
jgi:hypothetical protein